MIPRDFVVAVLLVLASNFAFCGTKQEQPERALSYRLALGEIRRLDPEPPIELVLYGDSRIRQLRAADLCEALTERPARCLNLSSPAGDWVTVWGVHARVAPRLAEEAIVVLALSEYWLEMGGRNPLGLIPNSTAYASLGDPLSTLESFLPLSRARAGLMRRTRERIDSLAAWVVGLVGAESPRRIEEKRDRGVPRSPLPRSNVDRSFRSPRPEDLAENRQRADAMLTALRAGGWRVVLAFLPNPADREEYVEAVYPGRRARFFERCGSSQGLTTSRS